MKKGCLVPAILFVFVLIALIVILVTVNTDDKNPPTNTLSQQYIDDLTDEQGKEIDAILKDCGLNNISNISHDELLDNAHEENESGYRIECDRSDNVILYLTKEKKVHSLIYADNKLYAKGKVKAKIQDFTFSTDEATKYQLLCEEQVKSVLKAPNTAKFPVITEWGFGKTKKNIIVQGYVDAQNSFGAEIRSDFQFKFDKETNSITSFIFDGQEQIQ